MSSEIADPLYRPRVELPGEGDVRRFPGGVEGVIVVTDTDPGTVEASYLPDRGVSLVLTDDVDPDALPAANRPES